VKSHFATFNTIRPNDWTFYELLNEIVSGALAEQLRSFVAQACDADSRDEAAHSSLPVHGPTL